MFSVIQQLHYSLQPTCNSPVNRFCNNLTVYYVTWKLLPSAKACTSSSSTSAQRQTSWNSIQSQVNSNYSHSLHPKTHPTNNGLLSRMVSRDFGISCLQLSYPSRRSHFDLYNRLCIWLRHCATIRKAAGSIPEVSLEFFFDTILLHYGQK